jgi:hypothetical protein
MTRSNPNFEQLLAFAAGELPSQEAAQVEAQLAMSSERAATVARLRATLAAMHAERGEAPSAAAVARALAIFKPAADRKANWLDRVQQVVAKLIYDSRVEPARAGFRGDNDGFELTVESEVGGIELQLEPEAAGDTWRVMGQVTVSGTRQAPTHETQPAETPPIQVALVPPGTRVARVQTGADEHGMFSFCATPGTYDLLVRVGDTIVVVPNVEVT